LSYEQLMLLKRLSFVGESPLVLEPNVLIEQHRRLFDHSKSWTRPVCLVSVGAPGSGKSYAIRETLMAELAASREGPAVDEYLTIDPDFWITSVLRNDNSARMLANYLNHETFMTAVHMRRNLLFDGTGRELKNTCGRVISRLKQAGYRVYIGIVLSSYEQCLRNIEARRKATGRDVPAKFVKPLFQGQLLASTEEYVRRQPELAEQIVIYDNDKLDARVAARVCNGSGTEEALAVLRKYLVNPDAAAR